MCGNTGQSREIRLVGSARVDVHNMGGQEVNKLLINPLAGALHKRSQLIQEEKLGLVEWCVVQLIEEHDTMNHDGH